MIILKLTPKNHDEIVIKAINLLKNSGIIIYPTETTYGIAVDATNQSAVDKLFLYKEKREGMPLSIAVADMKMAQDYVELNETAKNIYNNFLPGPVTVISKSLDKVAPGVASEKNTLGVRIPDYELVREIIKNFGKPITATSAAPYSSSKRPYKIEDVLENISQKQKSLIDLIIDAGELPHNNPSTVIDTVTGNLETVRFGDKRFDLENNILSKDVGETIELGKKLGTYVKNNLDQKPIIIAIQGDLGAGKTHFAGGVAQSLGIKDHVKSPTFILCNEFETDLENYPIFYHIDTYRMETDQDLLDIGYEKMISKPNIIFIEWADKVIPALDKFKDQCNFIWLKFEHIDENTRKISYGKEIFN